MNKKTVTMRDIAEQVGVSITTVSHVINKTRNVASETRELVLRTLEELDYQAAEPRQTVANKDLDRIGVITADISEDYYILLIKTIETIASENNISVLFCDSANDPEEEEKNINLMLSKNVEGLIIAPTAHCLYPEKLAESDIPIVLVDRQFDQHNTTFVGINNSESAEQGVNFLTQKGCQNIGFIGYEDSIYTMQKRIAGYKLGLMQHFPNKAPAVLRLKYSKEDSHARIKAFLKTNALDGVICGTSDLCYQLIAVVDDLQYAIPKDLNILTYDDNKWFEYLKFPVSVITQPVVEIACQAVESLISMNAQKRNTKQARTEILFDAQIVDRI